MQKAADAWRRELLRTVIGATDTQIDNGEFDDVSIYELTERRHSQWLAANGIPELTEDQRRLVDLMSDISEDAYCAGWNSGNEYRLWAMLAEPGDSGIYSRTVVTDEQIAEMRRLSELIGGWIEYVCDPTIEHAAWGERFVPLADWLPRFDEFRRKNPEPLD